MVTRQPLLPAFCMNPTPSCRNSCRLPSRKWSRVPIPATKAEMHGIPPLQEFAQTGRENTLCNPCGEYYFGKTEQSLPLRKPLSGLGFRPYGDPEHSICDQETRSPWEVQSCSMVASGSSRIGMPL